MPVIVFPCGQRPGPKEYMSLVLVSNENIYTDIKPHFYLLYQSILKYRIMDVFQESFQTLSQVLVVSQKVNRYGVSALSVSEI